MRSHVCAPPPLLPLPTVPAALALRELGMVGVVLLLLAMGAVVTVAEVGGGAVVVRAAGDAERAAAAAAAAAAVRLGAIFGGWLGVWRVGFWCGCRRGSNWVVGSSVGYEAVVVVVVVVEVWWIWRWQLTTSPQCSAQ